MSVKVINIKNNLSKKNYKNLLSDSKKVKELVKKRSKKNMLNAYIYENNINLIPRLPSILENSDNVNSNHSNTEIPKIKQFLKPKPDKSDAKKPDKSDAKKPNKSGKLNAGLF